MVIFLSISIILNIFLLFIVLSRNSQKTEGKIIKGVSGERKENTTASALNVDSTGEADLLDGFKSWYKSLQEQEKSGIADLFLKKVATDIQAVQGALYILELKEDKKFFRFKNGYAFSCPESKPVEFELGESLIGQVALDKKILNLNEAPVAHNSIISGLGKTTSQYLIICPMIKNEETVAVLEFSSFKPIDAGTERYIFSAADLVTQSIGWN